MVTNIRLDIVSSCILLHHHFADIDLDDVLGSALLHCPGYQQLYEQDVRARKIFKEEFLKHKCRMRSTFYGYSFDYFLILFDRDNEALLLRSDHRNWILGLMA